MISGTIQVDKAIEYLNIIAGIDGSVFYDEYGERIIADIPLINIGVIIDIFFNTHRSKVSIYSKGKLLTRVLMDTSDGPYWLADQIKFAIEHVNDEWLAYFTR